MTSQEDQLRDLVKNEADELLFGRLHFDTDMHEKILQLAQHETKLEDSPARITRSRRHPWLAGTAVAAMLIGLFLVLAEPGIIKSPGSPPLGEDPPVTLMDPDPGSSIDHPPGISDNEPRVLGSYEEAGDAFGDQLRIPSYLPKGFSLHQISVTGPKEAATEAVFSYTAAERSFGLFANKSGKANKPQHFDKTVDVNGTVGYLIAGVPSQDEGVTIPNVKLHWYTDDTHFMISGLVSAEEALRIARSMEPIQSQEK